MNWKKRHQNEPDTAASTEPEAVTPGQEAGQEVQPAPGVCEGGGEAVGEVGGTTPEDALQQLTAERDAANEKYLRALADLQNFQRRSRLNEEEARRQGMTSVLLSILPVLDHFDVAIEQTSKTKPDDPVLEGMRVIRAELVKALNLHGVSIISPSPNEEFDPHRHQAVAHQPAGDSGVQPGNVLSTFQAGYTLGDRVVRPAKVAVAAPG